MSQQVPTVDLRAPRSTVAKAIFDACRSGGFFYVVGHDVDEALIGKLMEHSHQFFALPDDIQARFAMPLGGRAWRGWFPLGGELTSGRPDWKEGLYLGTFVFPTLLHAPSNPTPSRLRPPGAKRAFVATMSRNGRDPYGFPFRRNPFLRRTFGVLVPHGEL